MNTFNTSVTGLASNSMLDRLTKAQPEDHLTLTAIKQYVGELTETKEGDVDFKVGVILMAALETGPNRVKVHKFTGYKFKFVDTVAHRLRRAGLWSGHRLDYEWMSAETLADPELLSISFICDCLVGTGQLAREKRKMALHGSLRYAHIKNRPV